MIYSQDTRFSLHSPVLSPCIYVFTSDLLNLLLLPIPSHILGYATDSILYTLIENCFLFHFNRIWTVWKNYNKIIKP